MKLTTLQENLSKAISVASRFTTSKAQLPILGNILLTTSKTKLNISSTNLEISISTSIGAKIEEEGQISIPSKVISEIINNLPKENIEMLTDKEQVKISSNSFNSKILGMDATDFPKIPNSLNKENSLLLKSKLFSDALGKTIFATSTDETRPVLTGVYLIFEKDQLQVVATDGFRLSRNIINIENKINKKVVIPKNVLSEVLRVDESSEFLFEVSDADKQVLFEMGDTVISSRLIEGDYPDFEKIIPKNSTTTVLLDKEEFLRAVKLASVFARESANVIKIKIQKDKIKVTAESSQSGSQEAEVDAKIERSETLSEAEGSLNVAFNYKFVEDFLHSVVGEEVKMELTDNQKAVLFTDTSDTNYLHLIMPVRVQS